MLDAFNRANGALGSAWTADPNGYGNLIPLIISNQVYANGGAAFSDAWWNAGTFGPDTEVYVDIATKPANDESIWLQLRATTIGASGEDSYELDFTTKSGTDEVSLARVENQGYTQLGATIAQEFANGDAIGMDVIGSSFTIYRRASGTWSSLGTRTDSTFTSAGYIVLGVRNQTLRVDNFGGGTVVAAGRTTKNDRAFPFGMELGMNIWATE